MNNNKLAQKPEVIVLVPSKLAVCQHHERIERDTDNNLIGCCVKCGQVKQYPRLDGYKDHEVSRQSLIFSGQFVRL